MKHKQARTPATNCPCSEKIPDTSLQKLLKDVRSCTLCAAHLPLGPRPVLRAHEKAQVMIVGQAPGTKVHATGIPWNDPSGDRLRKWMDVSREQFYDETRFAIIPMGFCYPGTGKSGDLPPRPECAQTWHNKLLAHLPNIKLTLLFGQYAQAYYLGDKRGKTLTETVKNWQMHTPAFLPMPHPSPRNIRWFKANPWFEENLVPELRRQLGTLDVYS